MKYQGIFFDLDGTLLPMDNDAFIKGYLGLLCKAVAHLGYTPETMVPTMWQGVAGVAPDRARRSILPVSVSVGSALVTTSLPFWRKASASIWIWVLFPQPSMPSKTINFPSFTA